ncbi:26716_t:CDS:2, partial [Dentiscutata erythropus]
MCSLTSKTNLIISDKLKVSNKIGTKASNEADAITIRENHTITPGEIGINSLNMIDFNYSAKMVMININTLNEHDILPFLWTLLRKPLDKNLLMWLGEKGAIFYHYEIKVTNNEFDQLILHKYIAKDGTLHQLEMLFGYFWDFYDPKIVNEALKYAKGKKQSCLKKLSKKFDERKLKLKDHLDELVIPLLS